MDGLGQGGSGPPYLYFCQIHFVFVAFVEKEGGIDKTHFELKQTKMKIECPGMKL